MIKALRLMCARNSWLILILGQSDWKSLAFGVKLGLKLQKEAS